MTFLYVWLLENVWLFTLPSDRDLFNFDNFVCICWDKSERKLSIEKKRKKIEGCHYNYFRIHSNVLQGTNMAALPVLWILDINSLIDQNGPFPLWGIKWHILIKCQRYIVRVYSQQHSIMIFTTAFHSDFSYICICLTSLTRAKCGTRSTLCWKVGNISGSTELFAL